MYTTVIVNLDVLTAILRRVARILVQKNEIAMSNFALFQNVMMASSKALKNIKIHRFRFNE